MYAAEKVVQFRFGWLLSIQLRKYYWGIGYLRGTSLHNEKSSSKYSDYISYCWSLRNIQVVEPAFERWGRHWCVVMPKSFYTVLGSKGSYQDIIAPLINEGYWSSAQEEDTNGKFHWHNSISASYLDFWNEAQVRETPALAVSSLLHKSVSNQGHRSLPALAEVI